MDPKWWYRGGIVIIVVVFILMMARASIVALRPDTAKIERAVDTPNAPAAAPAR